MFFVRGESSTSNYTLADNESAVEFALPVSEYNDYFTRIEQPYQNDIYQSFKLLKTLHVRQLYSYYQGLNLKCGLYGFLNGLYGVNAYRNLDQCDENKQYCDFMSKVFYQILSEENKFKEMIQEYQEIIKNNFKSYIAVETNNSYDLDLHYDEVVENVSPQVMDFLWKVVARDNAYIRDMIQEKILLYATITNPNEVLSTIDLINENISSDTDTERLFQDFQSKESVIAVIHISEHGHWTDLIAVKYNNVPFAYIIDSMNIERPYKKYESLLARLFANITEYNVKQVINYEEIDLQKLGNLLKFENSQNKFK